MGHGGGWGWASSAVGGGVGERPVAGFELDEVAAEGDTGELLEEETALAAAAQAELADELLVAGAVGRGTVDEADELAVGVGVRGRH